VNILKIKAENLYKIFDGKGQKEIEMLKDGMSKDDILEKTGATVGINDAGFEVEEGEIFVIMGLSGSGKSTLLRCINRLVEPTAGSVTVDGTDVTELNKDELREFRKEKFGMVFQNFALFPYRSVLENAEFGLEIEGVDKDSRRKKAMKALKHVGLEGY